MLNKYSIWWHYLVFTIMILSLMSWKITENEWLLYLSCYLLFFGLTERSVEKVISKNFKKLISLYILVGLLGVLLIFLFNWIGLFIIMIIMIAIALKITWEYHREEREKDNIKREKAKKKKQRQYRDLVKQRQKLRKEDDKDTPQLPR
ncbi:hypothetical protein [Sulfurimonas sp. CS5]|uniref:hypothetical protein n=1 Tax=Sulfurimonas sp. CS5 TaxID=3391145 RepID=UPI0039EB8655